MYAFEGLPASRQFAANRLDGRSPHERLRLLVPGFEELVDRPLEIGDADEGAAANAFAGELSEPSLEGKTMDMELHGTPPREAFSSQVVQRRTAALEC